MRSEEGRGEDGWGWDGMGWREWFVFPFFDFWRERKRKRERGRYEDIKGRCADVVLYLIRRFSSSEYSISELELDGWGF